MSSFNTQPFARTIYSGKNVSSATQTMLSLHFGPKVHLDVILQLQPREMKRESSKRGRTRHTQDHSDSEREKNGGLQEFQC